MKISHFKIILPLISAGIISFHASADSIPTVSKTIVMLKGGLALPLGNFASTGVYQTTDDFHYVTGSAKSGFSGIAAVEHFFSRHSGIALSFYYSKNEAEDPGSEKLMNSDYKFKEYWVDPASHFNSTPWQSAGIFAGYVLSTSKEKYNMSIRLQAGYLQMKSFSSEFYYSYYDGNPQEVYTSQYEYYSKQPSDISGNIAGEIGIDFRVHAFKHIGFLLSTDCLFTEMKFKGTATETSVTTIIYDEYSLTHEKSIGYSYKKSIVLMNIHAGIYYEFH